MKLKDLHTNLEKEINLLKFRPKKEISVDSFWVKNEIISDISVNKFKTTINFRKNKCIRIKKIHKKNNFDALNFSKNTAEINLLEDKWKGLKTLVNNNILKKIFWTRVFSPLKNKFNFFRKNILLKKIPNFIIYFFIFILIVFIDKSLVEYFTNSWYEKLISIKNNKETSNKYELIKSSNNNFKIANILFLPFKILPGEKIKNANNAILWGVQITNFTLNIYDFIEKSKNFIDKKWWENIAYSQLLENSNKIFIYSENEINKILQTYNKINFSNNKIRQNKLDYFKWELNKILFYTHEINNNFDTFLNILWHNKRKKYLIVFQNNDEIRAQWGFMWSMWIIEVFRWQIKKFEKKDVYNYEFKLKTEHFTRENAPEWLNKLTPKLGLRDSNYFINTKKSSEKIKFFINKAWYNIDWIIYINQNTLFEVLDLVWEYESKVLKTKVNSSNFSIIMSSLVEAKKSHIWSLWTPKQVLFDFMEEFKNILKQKNINKLDLAKIIFSDIKNREIKFYNFNKIERGLLEELWIYNPIKYSESLDFFYPVFTSISWNKSDRYIKTTYDKTVKKWNNCEYKTNLEIKLEHTFNNSELKKNKAIFNKFWIKKDLSKLLSIQWNWINRQYIRIILPKNAIIKKSPKIIIIKNYYNKWKIIDFYLDTPVWKKSKFNLEYTLPNKTCKIYNLKLYKQPWIREYNLDLNIFWEEKVFKNLKSDLFVN